MKNIKRITQLEAIYNICEDAKKSEFIDNSYDFECWFDDYNNLKFDDEWFIHYYKNFAYEWSRNEGKEYINYKLTISDNLLDTIKTITILWIYYEFFC